MGLIISISRYSHLDSWPGYLAFHSLTVMPYLLSAFAQCRHARNLSKLEAQVDTYSIRQADCFCCQHNHIHPDTGSPLPCDRDQVYNSIAHWYGGGNRER